MRLGLTTTLQASIIYTYVSSSGECCEDMPKNVKLELFTPFCPRGTSHDVACIPATAVDAQPYLPSPQVNALRPQQTGLEYDRI